MSNSNFYIHIDSRNRTYGNSTNFSVSMNDFSFSPGSTVTLSLSELNFYNLQYPVNSTNNTFTFYENNDTGALLSLTLTEGSYSGDEIATEFQTQLDANTANAYTYAVAYDDNTGRLTITLGVGDVFRFVSGDLILGFEDVGTFASVTTGTSLINMSGIEYVDLLIPTLVNRNVTTNSNRMGMVKRIPMSQSFGTMIVYKAQSSDDNIVIDSGYLNNLRFELRNPDGSFYDLQQGNLSIVLKCEVYGLQN